MSLIPNDTSLTTWHITLSPSQFDVSLVHAIEEYTMVKMVVSEEVQDDQVVPHALWRNQP